MQAGATLLEDHASRERYVNRILRKMVVAQQRCAMTQRKRSRDARTKWRKLISEQMRSGESVAAFCRERNLHASHFYWWKKRLRKKTTGRFVEVRVEDSRTNLPVDSHMEIRLQNGRSLEAWW
jgi:hypothetical protein